MPAETEQMFRNESVVGDEALHDAVDTQPVPAEQVVFSIDSEADREQLASAWRALKERHPVLETGMRVLPDGGMALFRRDDCDFEPTFHDWREEPDENAREEKLHRFLSTKRLTGFDLAHPPLIRVAMIRWNETRWRAVLTFVRRTLDWRSLSILIQDFVSGLNVTERAPKATANEPAHVPSIPVRPAGNANDVVFWRKFLSDLKSVNPFDGLNGAGHGLDGESADNIVQQLNRPASNELRQLCKAADVTLNNVVESAWALLMSRYSASRDVAFGIVRSCRRSTAPGNSDLAGFFTNVIPLRVRLDEDANIFELLRHARDQHRLVREHECNDLGVIRRSLREAGSDIALHSVVEFDLRNPMSALEELFAGFGPCDFRHYPGPEHGVRLQVHAEDEITLRLDYSASILDRNAAERLLDQYGRLLLAMAARPGVAVRNIDFLDEQDKAPITWPGAQRYATSGRSTSIHGGFEDRAALCPDAVAVSCGDTTLTYDELNRAANRLAHRLRRNGVQPDDLVGLCVERSIEQVVGILGILKSGAAYLPLDPSYPAERLKFMLQDAGVDTVVLHDDIESALPGMNARRIGIRIKEEEESSDNPEPRGGGRNLAYVIYTSGSTGQPKGVQVTHHNVMRLFDTCASWLNAGIGDVWTLFHSFAFDFSVWEIWGALLHGGRLEIVLRNVARSPDAFYRLLVDRRVTVLNQTPSAFQQLMRVDAESKGDLSALRLVVFGGEKLDLRSLRSWVRRHGDVSPHLVNMYGITETTVHVTYRPVTERDIEEATSSLIGWPLPDLYVRLLDEKRRPVPPGVRGEICVGGAGVTRGYLNRPELDERKFIADPLSGNPDARLYCSGDFARQASSGELVYLGRDDDQVKIRGFRIDLGEISNTVQDIDGVASAIVIPHETRAGVKRLVAYYVEETPGAMPEASLRDVLSKRLPEHMVPAVMIRLAEIPVNINNKTDLKALPDPSDIPSETVPAEEQPRTPAEKLLADIWSEVLERPVPGRRDDFFGLGGDSVLALQVVSKARAAGLEITPRDLFEHSELSALAAIARQAEAVESDETASTNADAAMALTPIQHWFLDQHFEQPQHFNQARLFKVAPETDIDLLEQACVEVVRRHEALRCRFEEDEQGNRSAHVVSAEDALEFSHIELDHLDENEREEAINLITDDIQSSLSIASGLLVRVAYFTGSHETGDRLMITIHQMAIDTVSWGIILQDIDTVYRALAAGKTPQLLPETTRYSQWAAQLARQASSPAIAGERPYWEGISGSRSDVPLVSPHESAEPHGRERDARTHTVSLAPSETRALLGEIHQAYGSDIVELLIAALVRACAETWPASHCLSMDIERHGRDTVLGDMDISRTVGWLTVRHPVALDLQAASSTGRLICDVKTRMRSASYGGIGWSILNCLPSDHGPSSHRGPHGETDTRNAAVLFRYLGQFEKVLDTPVLKYLGDEAGALRSPDNHLAHPLAITTVVRDDRLEMEFRYDSLAIDGKMLETLAERTIRALEVIVQHCRMRDSITRSPVDFPLAQLSQDELDDFPIDLRDVEDILPLSPIQRLYHALSGTDRDIGFDQWVFRLQGRIDETAFEAGWRSLLKRHEALRTIFVDEGLAQPHQAVLRDVKFRLQRSDWRLLDADTQEQRLAEFLAADRTQGFRMDLAPLTRVTLIRAGEQEWILVWSHHKSQVDGWSWPVIAEELGELHDANIESRRAALEPAGSYRNYIAWLMQRDRSEYADFWRRHLDTGSARTLVTRSRRQADGSGNLHERETVTLQLSEALGDAVGKLARTLRLTPSTVFQGAWALLLSALTTRFNVTFGIAFSGRTAGIPVAAHTIGPFVNDLPVNFRIDPESRADHWLAELRKVQAEINHYQNVSPGEIHEWTGAPVNRRFFDSLLVFQNYATGKAASRWGANIKVKRFSPGVVTNYPLAVGITPGRRYRLDLVHDPAAIDGRAVAALGNDLVTVLELLCRTPDIRVSTIIKHLSSTVESERLSASVETPVAERNGRRHTDGERGDIQVTAPDPDPDLRSQRAPNAGKRSDTETTVAEICCKVLGMDRLDARKNFFEAGAQSISLIEIHDRLQRALGRTFPIVKLFQHPSIAALSHYLDVGDITSSSGPAATRAAQRRAALQQRRRCQPGRFDNPT